MWRGHRIDCLRVCWQSPQAGTTTDILSAMQTLSIRCGPRALATLKREGLRPGDVEIIPAAAGGPKGLALNGLDCALFGEWLPQQPRQRQLIGASVGAWRMAAATQADPVAAFTRLAGAYCEQRYSDKPKADEISAVCQQLVAQIVDNREAEILGNTHNHLNILTVRGKKLLAQDGPRRTPAGFAAAAAFNAVSRRHLRHWLDRVWFYDPRKKTDLLPLDDFHTGEVPLSAENLHAALLASGAIPLVLNAVTDISGAPPGYYWDGGIIDYHLHLPFERAEGLVLYPHFTDHIVPGWLDKFHKSRRAAGPALDNLVLISPSPEFVATLPNGKLPDRSDFKHYGPKRQHERIRDWRCAVSESRRLGDEFLTIVENGEIAGRAIPL